MNRKEIEEKFNNLTKDNYIYQRYNGIITKYIKREGYYIDCATGIGTKIEGYLLLGKTSKNLINLIEVGDFVNGKLIHKIDKGSNYCYLYYGNCKTFVNYQIKEILTKESYIANCYKVGGEDE